MGIIVVNNPAAKSGGALTVLKNYLSDYSKDNENKYYFFVSLEELRSYENENLIVIVIPTQGTFRRILWDNFGLKQTLKKMGITPNRFISLQNTGVNLPANIPQIIYYHQAIPLSPEKWSIFKKEERKFWIYKNIYPIFIKQYLNRVEKVIVQTEWIKRSFSKKFKFPLEKIEKTKLKINLPEKSQVKTLEKNEFCIFYPATPLKYKNHKFLIEVLKDINEEFQCIFTFEKEDNPELFTLITEYKLSNKIKLVGKISYEKVLEYYKNCDLMAFPSSIETYGLPLVEAAYFEKNILALDQEYPKEVLEGYEKVEFLNLDKKMWMESILNHLNNFRIERRSL